MQQQQQLPPPAFPATTQTNTMAVVSLATGIASWIVIPVVGGVVAVVTGHIARKEIRQSGEQGDGFAVAGLVLGYLHLAAAALVILLLLLVFFGVLGAIYMGAGHPGG
jgi:hypothetical protein